MKTLLTLFILLFSMISMADNLDIYHFDSKAKLEQFQQLNHQIRCLVCQNQNLAESNAPLAADLRVQIAKKLETAKPIKQLLTI